MTSSRTKLLKDIFSLTDIEEVQAKNGVYVYQVKTNKGSYYLKHFEKKRDAKEILCYKALSDIGIPIIGFYDHNEHAILLENMSESNSYRLGTDQDFLNSRAIKSMAEWFRKLHTQAGMKNSKFNFLDEENVHLRPEDISLCRAHYGDSEFFKIMSHNLGKLNNYLDKREKVVIHDDFYWKNFFVHNETDEIIMFDFNFMKRGLLSQELSLIRRNLRSSSEESERIFLETYGDFNKLEYSVYSIFRHVSCLTEALSYDEFPKWSLESIRLLKSEKLKESLITSLDMLKGEV